MKSILTKFLNSVLKKRLGGGGDMSDYLNIRWNLVGVEYSDISGGGRS